MGAVGMLGGVSRMTISLSVILMETTQNLQFLLPIMMILLISKWVGDLFNISLYDLHVEIACMPFVEASPPLGMENMVAGWKCSMESAWILGIEKFLNLFLDGRPTIFLHVVFLDVQKVLDVHL